MKSKFASLALAALMAFTGVANAGCLDYIKKAGVIKAGNATLGTKPFLYKNEDGSLAGFEWEIFQELGKRLGIARQEYVLTEWTTLIPGLKASRWDIILSSMASTQERIQNAGVAFSNPYMLLYDVVIVKKDSPIKSVADLKGKILGSTLGTLDSLNANVLVQQGLAGSVLDFNDFALPFTALRNGQVDAVVMDQGTLLGQQEGLNDLRTLGEPITYRAKPEWAEAEAKAPYVLGGLAIGIRKDCPELVTAVNDALASMDADGTRKKIVEKYGMWSGLQVKLLK
ncbi:MAG: transporter substrate-binding domain-containing protein [Mesorhizobium sp.]|nr:MAG: transporter substrate-binding domain-containing protein [Mesorhizobium sp.]